MDPELMRKQIALMGLSKPDAYNPYAAGQKVYGYGQTAPNQGAVSASGMQGYQQRDRQVQAKKNALQRMIQARASGNYLSSDNLRGI